MKKHMKFVLQVTIFFFAMLIVLSVMKHFLLINYVWPGAIGATMGYAIVLNINKKKTNNRNE